MAEGVQSVGDQPMVPIELAQRMGPIMTTIESRIARLMGELREELPADIWENPPVDLASIGNPWGVKKVVERPLDRPGFLYRIDGGGFIIFLNESDPATRQRFTWAHELGHILMAKDSSIGISCIREGEIDKELEDACNVIAAELLMPLESFESAAEATGWQLEGVEKLARQFNVSAESVAIRMHKLLGEPVMMSVWRASNKPFTLLDYRWSRPNNLARELSPNIQWKDNPENFIPIFEAFDSSSVTTGLCRLLVRRVPRSKSRSYQWVYTKGLGIGQGKNRGVIGFHYLVGRN